MSNKVELPISKDLYSKLADIGVSKLCVDIASIGVTYNTVGGEKSNEHVELVFSEKPQPQPRTKVEYVKVEFSHAWEAVKAFEDGEVFHTHFMTDGWVIVEHVQQVIPNLQVEKLYRCIETEITERDEFIDEMPKPDFEAWFWELDSVDRDGEYRLGVKGRLTTLFNDQLKVIYDSGKFKLVTSD